MGYLAAYAFGAMVTFAVIAALAGCERPQQPAPRPQPDQPVVPAPKPWR